MGAMTMRFDSVRSPRVYPDKRLICLVNSSFVFYSIRLCKPYPLSQFTKNERMHLASGRKGGGAGMDLSESRQLNAMWGGRMVYFCSGQSGHEWRTYVGIFPS